MVPLVHTLVGMCVYIVCSAEIFKTDAEISRTNGSSAGKELQVCGSSSRSDKFPLVAVWAQLLPRFPANVVDCKLQVSCATTQFKAAGYVCVSCWEC